jgi:hypothetical protein
MIFFARSGHHTSSRVSGDFQAHGMFNVVEVEGAWIAFQQLHCAASRGHVKAVKWLLKRGAKLGPDKHGKTPLKDAQDNRQSEVVHILEAYENSETSDETYFDENDEAIPCTCRPQDHQENDIKSAGRKPFYLHPPSNNSESGEEQTRTSNLHNNKPPLRRSGLPNYSSADERLKQYSAYELNRRPNKKKSSQSQISPDSSGSFFLHDPTSTLGYNRLSDLFPLNSAAQTVCSDDSGVGLTSQPPVKPLTRPRQKPPKPPGKKAHILKIEINNFCQ